MRRMKKSRIDVLRDDLKFVVDQDGDTVTFVWKEMSGGTWNETYQAQEGGVETPKEYKLKGIGKVVDYKEDEMEYEYGRIRVGQCIVRFPFDADLSPIMDKEGVRFLYKGQRWKIDSPLGIGDVHGDEQFSLILQGVKASD